MGWPNFGSSLIFHYILYSIFEDWDLDQKPNLYTPNHMLILFGGGGGCIGDLGFFLHRAVLYKMYKYTMCNTQSICMHRNNYIYILISWKIIRLQKQYKSVNVTGKKKNTEKKQLSVLIVLQTWNKCSKCSHTN